jgi:hypothetical protein
MNRNSNDPNSPSRLPRKIIWIVGAILIALVVLVALQGIILGTGEAVGIKEAAPGGADATAGQTGEGNRR